MVPRILYVCTHLGARARIAEEFTRQLAAGKVDACSSCFESGRLGPLPIGALREVGIELPAESPMLVFERCRGREVFDHVVTICREASDEYCSIFNQAVAALYGNSAQLISWSVQDFLSLKGNAEEKQAAARGIRDQIRANVLTLLTSLGIDVDRGSGVHGPAAEQED